MGGLNSGPGPGITLLIAIVIVLAHTASSAPLYEDEEGQESNSHALVESHGCYYNFQHYNEGERILTNEPCLNCTCRNRMLMCYLRVCPFTKGIGQNCTVEKVPGQCCPIITCPEVPVQLLTSTTTEGIKSPGGHHGTKNTAVGHLDTNGCNIDGVFYPNGAQVPGAPEKPCELCYCIRNKTSCIMQECALQVDGCRPVYEEGQCFPVRYQCDDAPFIEESTTTIRPPPTPGLIITTTASEPLDCTHNNEIYEDGSRIQTEDPCEHCYCLKGKIACAVQECGAPLEKEGQNCTALPPAPGKCCPDSYQCDNNVIVQAKENFLRTDRKQKFEPKVIENNDVTMTSQGLSHEGTTKPGIPSLDSAGHSTQGYLPDETSGTAEHTTNPLNQITTAHSKGTEDVKPELDKGTQPDGHLEGLRPVKPGSTSDSDQKITFPDDKGTGSLTPVATKEPESSDHTSEGHIIHTANEKQPDPESESHKTQMSAGHPIEGTDSKEPGDFLKPGSTTDPLLDKLHNIIQNVQAQVSDGKTTEMAEQIDYQTTNSIQTGHFTEKPDILSHFPHLGSHGSTPKPIESESGTPGTKPPEDGNDIINKLQGIIHGIYSHVTDSILTSKGPESTTTVGETATNKPIDSVGTDKPHKEELQPHEGAEAVQPQQTLQPKPEDSKHPHTAGGTEEHDRTKIPVTSKPHESNQFPPEKHSGQYPEKIEPSPHHPEGVKPGQHYPDEVSPTGEHADGSKPVHYPEGVKPGHKYPESATSTEEYLEEGGPTGKYPEGVQPVGEYPEKLKPGQSVDKYPLVGKPIGEHPELIKQPGEYPEKLKPGYPTDKLPGVVYTGQYHRPTEEYPDGVTSTGEYPEGIASGQTHPEQKPGHLLSEGMKPGQKYPEGFRPTEEYPEDVKPTGGYYPEGGTPGQKYPEGVRPMGEYPERLKPGQKHPDEFGPTEEYEEGTRPTGVYPDEVQPGQHHPGGTRPGQKYPERVKPGQKHPDEHTPTEEYSEGLRPTGVYPDGVKPGQHYPEGIRPGQKYPEGYPGKYPPGVRPTEGYPEDGKPTEDFSENVSSTGTYPEGVSPTVLYPEGVKPGKIQPGQKYPQGHYPEKVKPTGESLASKKPGQNYPDNVDSTTSSPEEGSATESYPHGFKPSNDYQGEVKPGQQHPAGVRPTAEYPHKAKPEQKFPGGVRPTEEYPESVTSTEQYYDGVRPTGLYPDRVRPGQHFPQRKPGQKYPDDVRPTEEYPDGSESTEEYPESVTEPGKYPDGFRPTQKYPTGFKPVHHYPAGGKPGQKYPEGVIPTEEYPEEGKPTEEYPVGGKPGQKYPTHRPSDQYPGEHHPEYVKPEEKYPEGFKPGHHYPHGGKPGQKYPEGVKPTEEYPEEDKATEEYPAEEKPGQHYPDSLKITEKYPHEGRPTEYPEGITATEKNQEGIESIQQYKPGQKYPDSEKPTGQYPEDIKETEKHPEGVKPNQDNSEKLKPQGLPDRKRPEEKYPDGIRPTEEYSTEQYPHGVRPTEHYPEGVEPGKYPGGIKPGEKYPDGVKPEQSYPGDERPTEENLAGTQPTETYPLHLKPGQKYPEKAKPGQKYPEGTEPSDSYPEGVKPEQNFPEGIRPTEEYPENAEPEHKYPEGFQPVGQYPEKFKPGQHYPEGVRPGDKHPDGTRPISELPTGSEHPVRGKPHSPDKYPETDTDSESYTTEYPEELTTTDSTAQFGIYPEGFKPEKPGKHGPSGVTGKPESSTKYPELLKPEEQSKYPDGYKPKEPTGVQGEDSKYPEEPVSSEQYPGSSKRPSTGKRPQKPKPAADEVPFGTESPEFTDTTEGEYLQEFKPSGQRHPATGKPEDDNKYPEESKPTEHYPEYPEKETGKPDDYSEGFRPTGDYPHGSKVTGRPSSKYPQKPKPGSADDLTGTEYPETTENEVEDEFSTSRYPVKGKPEYSTEYPSELTKKPGSVKRPYKPESGEEAEFLGTTDSPLEEEGKPESDKHGLKHPEERPTSDNDQPEELEDDLYGTVSPTDATGRPELYPGVSKRPLGSHKRPEKPDHIYPTERPESGVTEKPQSPSEKHPQEELEPTGKYPGQSHVTDEPGKYPQKEPSENEHPESFDSKYPDKTTSGQSKPSDSEESEADKPHGSYTTEKTYFTEYPEKPSPPNAEDQLLETNSKTTSRPGDFGKLPQGSTHMKETDKTSVTGRPDDLKPTYGTEYPENVPGFKPEDYTKHPEGVKPIEHPESGSETIKHPEGEAPDDSTKYSEGSKPTEHPSHPDDARPHGSEPIDKTGTKVSETQTSYPEGLTSTGHYSGSTGKPQYSSKQPEDELPHGTEYSGTAVTGRPHNSKHPYTTDYPQTDEGNESTNYPHPEYKPSSHYPDRPQDYSENLEESKHPQTTEHLEGTKPEEKYPDGNQPTEEYPAEQHSENVRPTEGFSEKIKPGQKYPGDARPTEGYPDGAEPTKVYPRPTDKYSEGGKPGQNYPEEVHPTGAYPEENKLTNQYPDGVRPTEGYFDSVKPGQKYPDGSRPTEVYPDGVTSTGLHPIGVRPNDKYPEGVKPGQKLPSVVRPTEGYSEEEKSTEGYSEGFTPTELYSEGLQPTHKYPEAGEQYPHKEKPGQSYPEDIKPGQKYPGAVGQTEKYPEDYKPTGEYSPGVKPGQKFPDIVRPTEEYPDRATGEYPDGVRPTEQYPEELKPQHSPAEGKPGQKYPNFVGGTEKYPEESEPEQKFPEADGVKPTEGNPEEGSPTDKYPEGVKPDQDLKPGQSYPDKETVTEQPLAGVRPDGHYPEHARPTELYPGGMKPTEDYPGKVKPGQAHPDDVSSTEIYPESSTLSGYYPGGVRPGQDYPENVKPGQKYPDGFDPAHQFSGQGRPTEEFPEDVGSTASYPEGIKPVDHYPEGVQPGQHTSEGVKPGQKHPAGVRPTAEYPEAVTSTEQYYDGVRPTGHYPDRVRPGQHFPQRKPGQKYPDDVRPTEEYPDGSESTEEYPESVTEPGKYPDGFRPTQKYPTGFKPVHHYPAGGKPGQKYPEGIIPTEEYPEEGKPTEEYPVGGKPGQKYPIHRPSDQYPGEHHPAEEKYPEGFKPGHIKHPSDVSLTERYPEEEKPTEVYSGGEKPDGQHPVDEHLSDSKHPVRQKPVRPQTGRPHDSEYDTESPENYGTDRPDVSTKYPEEFSSTGQYPGHPHASPHYPHGTEHPETEGTGTPEGHFSSTGQPQHSTKYPGDFKPQGVTSSESSGFTDNTEKHSDLADSATEFPHISGVTNVKPEHEEPEGGSFPESSTEYSEEKKPEISPSSDEQTGSTSNDSKEHESFKPTTKYPVGSKGTSKPHGSSKYPQRPKPGFEDDIAGTEYPETTGRPVHYPGYTENPDGTDVTEYPKETEGSDGLKPTSEEKFGVTGEPHASTHHPESKPLPGVAHYPDETGSTTYTDGEEQEGTEHPEVSGTDRPGHSKHPLTERPNDRHPQSTTPFGSDSKYGTQNPEEHPGDLTKYPQVPGSDEQVYETEQPNEITVTDTTEHFGTVSKRPTKYPIRLKPGESKLPSSTKYPGDESTEHPLGSIYPQPEGTEKPFGTDEYSGKPKPGSEYPKEEGTTRIPNQDGKYPESGKPRPSVTDEGGVTGKPDIGKHPQKPRPEEDYYGTEHPETTGTALAGEPEAQTEYPEKPGEVEKDGSKPAGSEHKPGESDELQKYPDSSKVTKYPDDSKYSSTSARVPGKHPQLDGADDYGTEQSVSTGTEYPEEADNAVKPDDEYPEGITGRPGSHKRPQRPKPSGSEDEVFGTEYPQIRPTGATSDDHHITPGKYPSEAEKYPSTTYSEGVTGKPEDKHPEEFHPGMTVKHPEEQKPYGTESPSETGATDQDGLVTPSSPEKGEAHKTPGVTHQPEQYPSTYKPGTGYLPQEGGSPIESVSSNEHLNENSLPEGTVQPGLGFTDRIPATEEPGEEDLLTNLHHFTGHQDKPSSADLTQDSESASPGQHSTTKQPSSYQETHAPTDSKKPSESEPVRPSVSVDDYPERPKPVAPGEGFYKPVKDYESTTHPTEASGTTVSEGKKPDESSVNKYPGSEGVGKYPEGVSSVKPEDYATLGTEKTATEKPSSVNRLPEEHVTEEGSTTFLPVGGFTEKPSGVAPDKTVYSEKESAAGIQTTPGDDDLINKLHNIISGIQSQVTDGKTTKLPHEEDYSTTPFDLETDVLQTTDKFGRPVEKTQQSSQTLGSSTPGSEVDEHTVIPQFGYPLVGGSTQESVTIPERGPEGIQPSEGDGRPSVTPASETKVKPQSAGHQEPVVPTQDKGPSYTDEQGSSSKYPESYTTLTPEFDGVTDPSSKPSTTRIPGSSLNEMTTGTSDEGAPVEPFDNSSFAEADKMGTTKPDEHLQTVTPQDVSHKHPSLSSTDKPLHVVYPTYYPDGVVTRKPTTKPDEGSDKKVTVTPQNTVYGETSTKTPESSSTVESHTVYDVQTEISSEPGTSPVVIVHEVHTEVHSERATTKPETDVYDKPTSEPELTHLPEGITRQPGIVQPSSDSHIFQPHGSQLTKQPELTTKPALFTITPVGSISSTKESEHIMNLYSPKDKHPSKTTSHSPESITTASPIYPEDVKQSEQSTSGIPDGNSITDSPIGTTFRPEILGTRFPSRKTTQKPGSQIFQEGTTSFPTEGIEDYHSPHVTQQPVVISTEGLPDGTSEDKHTTPDFFLVTDTTKQPSKGASYVPYKIVNGTKVYYPEKESQQKPTVLSPFDGYSYIPYEVINGTKLFYPNRVVTEKPEQPATMSTPMGMLIPYKIVNGNKVYYTEEVPEKPENFDGIDFVPFDIVNGTKVFYPNRVTTATPPGSSMYVPFKIINGTKLYYPDDAQEEPENIPDEYDGFDYIPYDLVDGNKVFHPDRIPGHIPTSEEYPAMYVPYKLVNGNKVYYPKEAQTEPESVPDEYDGFDLVPYEVINGTKFFHPDRLTTPPPASTTTVTPAMFVPFKLINGTKVYFPKHAQNKPTHSTEEFDGFDYLPYEDVNGTKVFSPERVTPRPEYTSTPAFYPNGMFVPYKIINNRKVFFPQDAQHKPRPLKPGYDGVQYLPYDIVNGTKVFHPEKVPSKPSAMYVPYKLVNGTKVYYPEKATENQNQIPKGYDGFDYVPYEVVNGNKIFYPDRVAPTAGMFVPYKKINGTKVYHPKDANEKLHRVPADYDGVDYIPYEVINGTKVFHPEKAVPAHPPATMYVPFRIINGTKVYFPKDARPKPYFPEGYDGADTLPYEVVNGTKVFHPEAVTQPPTPATTTTPAHPQGMFVPYKVINGTKVYFTEEAHKRPHPLSDEYAGLDYIPYEVVNGTKVFHPERVSPSSTPAMYVPYKIVNGTKVFYPKHAQHDPQQIPAEYDGLDYVPYETVNGTRVFYPNRVPSYPGMYVPYKIINGQKVFFPNRAQYNPSNALDGYHGFDYLPYDTINGTKVFRPIEVTMETPSEQAMYVPYKIINGTKVFYPKHAQNKPYLIPEGFDGFDYIPYKIVNGNKVFSPELTETSATPATPYKSAMYVPFKIVNGKKVYYPKYAQSKPQHVPEGYDGFDYVPFEVVNGTKVFHPEQVVTPGTPFRPAMYVPFKIVNGKKVYYPKYAQQTPQLVPEGYDGFDYIPYETVNGTKVFHPEQAVTPTAPLKPAMYVPFKIVNGKKVYYPKHAQQKPQYVPEGYEGFDYIPYEVVNGSKVFHPEQAITPATSFKPTMYVPYKIVSGNKVYYPKLAQAKPTAAPEGYDGVDYLPYDLVNGNRVFYPEHTVPVKEAMYVPYKLVNGTKVFYPKHAQYIPTQTPEGYDGFEYIPYVIKNGEKVFLPEQAVATEAPFKKALYVPYRITNGTKVYYPKNAQSSPHLLPSGYDGYDYLPFEEVNGNKVFHPEQAKPLETPSKQAMYVPFKIVNGTKVYYPKYAKPKPQLIPSGYDGFDYLPYDIVNGTKVFDPKTPSKPTNLQGMYVPYKLSNNTKVFYPKDAHNKPNYVPEGYDGADYVPYELVNNTKMFYPELISTTQPVQSGTQGVYVPFKLVNNKKVFYPKEATPFPPTVNYPYDGVAFVPYNIGSGPSEIVYVDDDDSLKPHRQSSQPGYVPGEGSCYLNNKTFANNTEIPPVSPCQAKCMCLSSVVRCVRVKCPAPPENRLDCSPVYREGSCCPTYACGDSEYATTVGYPETVPQSSASSSHGYGIDSTTAVTDFAHKKPSTGSATSSEEYHLHKPPKPKPKPEHESLEPYDSVEGQLSPDEDYDVEDEEPYGPGTCRYAGKVYVSAQQIPRDDPCDFCFCFRSDIICLQQSCPPPIPGCRDEPIQGFCCPRYECHVKTATIVNMTSTTTTTTTTLPPHFLRKPIKGWSPGCVVQGKAYRVGTAIPSASGPCMDCYCGGNGRMQCEPKVCTPEPIIRKMIGPSENATVSADER